MKNNRPLIVTFIGDMTFVFALLSFVSGIFGAVKAFRSMTEPNTVYVNIGIVILLEFISILIPFGLMVAAVSFLKLKGWGYWTLVFGDGLILLLAIIAMAQSALNTSYLIVLAPVISLAFIIPTKKYFKKPEEVL